MLSAKGKHSQALAGIAFSLVLALSPLSLAEVKTTKQIVRDTVPSVVKIVVVDRKGDELGLGSGFFVAPNTVATNFHVIQGAAGIHGNIYVNVVGNKTRHPIAEIIGNDEERDLALLRVKEVNARPLQFADSKTVSIGENVYAVGNPAGFEGTFTSGIISGTEREEGLLQFTASISPGSSGGPLVNEYGQMVGIVVAFVAGGQNLNFAVPSEALARLMKRHSISPFPPQGTPDLRAVKPPSPPHLQGITAYIRGDYATALRKLKPLAQNGVASAQFYLGLMYANGRGMPQDHKDALRWFRLAADQSGYAKAQFALGFIYATGQGVPQDNKEALHWYRLSAEQGNVAAQYNLGLMYDGGQGVLQDDKEALRWYRLAAEQGVADAQYSLGGIYAAGQGVPQDNNEALHWYRLAAHQGHVHAQVTLGGLYGMGQGVPQDYKEALHWSRLAAEQGDAGAQLNLGHMYARGHAVLQDDREALRWYRLAAEQGLADAQFTLGFMCATGQGVPQDTKEALRWYRLAAHQEYAPAQFNLGEMYDTGEGVSQDHIQAHIWWNLAAAQGDKESPDERDRVAGKMTQSQIEQAQRLASEWKRKK